jgi:hypothetical protein
MLIFAIDIYKRDHFNALEKDDPELKRYMEYQRDLFPYTIVRGGLDLAYKEIDDMLNYIDAGYKPPPGSQRKDYPADVTGWYKTRFPWTSAFISMEDMHNLMVNMIKCMDSFRTHEDALAWHWMIGYDAVHNMVNVYNGLLKEAPENARDSRLSRGQEVNFEDFINNYWPNLHFMLLSKPDFSHTRLIEKNLEIETAIHNRTPPGDSPIPALEEIAESFNIDKSVLSLLKHESINTMEIEPISNDDGPDVYNHLYELISDGSPFAGIPLVDAQYSMNSKIVSIPSLNES